MDNKFGFVKVAAATFDVSVGNPMKNAMAMTELAQRAKEQGVQVLVFPELSVTGATCGDLFYQSYLQSETWKAMRYLLQNLDCTMVVVVRPPVRKDQKLFNTAAVLHDGRILGFIPKSCLSGGNGQAEARWFAPAEESVSDVFTIPEHVVDLECPRTVPFDPRLIFEASNGIRLACEIGQDLLALYPPSAMHAMKGANIIVNPAAANTMVAKEEYQRKVVETQSGRCMCAYIYANAGIGESTTDMVFTGHKLITEGGIVKAEAKTDDALLTAVIDLERLENRRIQDGKQYAIPESIKQSTYRTMPLHRVSGRPVPRENEIDAYPFIPHISKRAARCQEIIDLQAGALAERLRKTGIEKCVIGVSGGLDSTLALIVAVEVYKKLNWPISDIIGITMPGFGTTRKTKSNAEILMAKLGVQMRTIDITAACKQHLKDIEHPEDLYDVTFENVQARERTQILMDVANQENALVIGTGDMSELALGWCTYNGDHMSMYGVNANVPKTLVKYLVEAYASMHPALSDVLHSIYDTTISPELLPPDANGNIQQSTEETLGKYDLHDFFLYHFIRNGFSKEKIRLLAGIAFPNVEEAVIDRTLETFYKRFFSQQFKRSCMPDGPRIGTISLSLRGGLQMPSDVSYIC